MANRFYDKYRPAHDGQSVMGGGMINNPKHPDVQGPYSSDWQEHVWNMPRSTSKKGGPKHNPSLGKNNPWDGDGPTKENPAGGSSVPRKPKPSPKNPSGGMKLPLPTKVGQ